jgi:hypothetical protein
MSMGVCAIAQTGRAHAGIVTVVAAWTATATANATPDRLLEVLTHPEEIRRWSPVSFELGDSDDARLDAGARIRVTGRLAGVAVGFDVEVHAAGDGGLELSADGPIGLDVRYEVTGDGTGSELSASVAMRRGGGIRGRLVANAAATLLSAGALDSATRRIADAAESQLSSADSELWALAA